MNKKIILRRFIPEDLRLLKKWLNASHVKPWFDNPKAWLEEAENIDGKYSFIKHYTALFDNEPIGFCQYYKYEAGGENWQGKIDIKGAYSIDYLIGESAALGKGLGVQIITELINKVRENKDATKIIVKPKEENLPSVNALKASGFAFDKENSLYIMNL